MESSCRRRATVSSGMTADRRGRQLQREREFVEQQAQTHDRFRAVGRELDRGVGRGRGLAKSGMPPRPPLWASSRSLGVASGSRCTTCSPRSWMAG